MDAPRWGQIQSIFIAALDVEPGDRDAFLDRACADDPAIRRDVEALLDGHRPERALAIEDRLLVDQADTDADPDPLAGTHVGPYRIRRRVGRGGMGDVYLAERDDAQYHQEVALKLVRPGLHPTDVTHRFRAERQILARLIHPHIARLLDGGVTDDGLPYLVMEYVAGTRITEYCDHRRLSIADRLRLFCTVCEAVQFAHRNLIVHRDVKPSNVLVTEAGEVKLLDFGIAKLLDPEVADISVPFTQTAIRVMTPEYAAPEQVRGDAITTATDVYALGALLYELLTGHRPYQLPSHTPVDIERIICREEPSWPSTVVGTHREVTTAEGTVETVAPDRASEVRATDVGRLRRTLRGDLDNIVMMALRKEPDRRYASAGQLAEDIGRYLAGRPVIARKDTLGYRARKFVRRNRTGVAVAVGVFALVLSFGIVMGVQATRIANQAAVIAQERDRARLEAQKATHVSDFLEDLFEAPDPYAASERPDTVPVGVFLAQGADKVRRDLDEEPAVQAQLLHVLGRVFRRMGRYAEARPLLEQSLQIRRELEDPEIAETLEQLGLVQRVEAEFEEARATFGRALALHRQEDGAGQESEARVLSQLASVEWQAGAHDSAKAFAARALAIRERVLEPGDPRIGESLRQLGIVHGHVDEYERALDFYRRALPILEASHGPDDLEVASLRESMALVLDTMGETDSALVIHEAVLALRERRLNEDHPSIAYSLHNLGRLLNGRGQRGRARELFVRAIAIRERAFGSDHPQVGYVLESLAILTAQSGDLAGARRLFERSLTISESALGPTHPETIETLQNLAILAALEGEADRALLLLQTAVDRGYEDVDVIDGDGFASLRGNPAFEELRLIVRQRADAKTRLP